MKKSSKVRNGLVHAMVIRHAGNTTMKARREKRVANPKKSWKSEY